MKILGIIPARYKSTRFPHKPLADIAGKTMIQRVYEQCKKSQDLNEVIVATDHQSIVDEVKQFGGKVILTKNDHSSGTDRVNEVAQQFANHYDVVINIQGDEPFIDPLQIMQVISCFENSDVQIATLIKKIKNRAILQDVNNPKVIIDKNNNAIYFSRLPIPYNKSLTEANFKEQTPFYQHIGIYGFRINTLSELTKLPVSALEKSESLEQLRWIENGYKIATQETYSESISIDTPEDLQKLLTTLK